MERLSILIFLLLFSISGAWANEYWLLKRDLSADWQVYNNNVTVPYEEGQSRQTIHFTITSATYRGDFLKLQAAKSFSLFINNQLVEGDCKSALLSIDSLAAQHGSSIRISIFRKTGITSANLITQLVTTLNAPVEDNSKASTHFLDFLWTGFIVLLSLGIILLRFNPRLFADYFSVIRLFSLREPEDAQSYSRVTSTTVVFYMLTGLIIGLFLIMLANVDPLFQAEHRLNLSSFGYCWLSWITLAGIVLLIIIIKIIVVYIFCTLFGFGDEAGYHIFNYIRFLLVVATLVLFSTALLVVMRVEYDVWIKNVFEILKFIPALWIIVLFLKMSNRVPYTMFHLFCYLCATEIIPQLIITKILFE